MLYQVKLVQLTFDDFEWPKLSISNNNKLLCFCASRERVRLEFGAIAVDLLAYVDIIAPDGRVDTINDVWEFQGNITALWPLIGQKMQKIVMDEDSFRLSFEDGTLIRAKNRKDYDFVILWGPKPGYRTGYPTVLHYLAQGSATRSN